MRKFCMVISFVALLCPSAPAAVPPLINFQGLLRDGGGNPVANGSYSVIFTMYDAFSGGDAIWAETTSVSTSAGVFAVLLGSLNPVPDSAFGSPNRWLGIRLAADPEMAPRQQFVSLGYAYRVSSVDGALGGTITSKVSIGPGQTNTGSDGFVAGALSTVSGNNATVGGGLTNTASGDRSTVSGGGLNLATQPFATVGGGGANNATGPSSVVGGGFDNTADGDAATVGGGAYDTAYGAFSTVGGGAKNVASGDTSVVGGGASNLASGRFSTVGGGVASIASGTYATVPGGFQNIATGSSSLAAGARAQALHAGTFVWSEGTPFSSTGANQFLISAPGGVGIGTNSPATATGGQVLHVNNATGASAVRIGDDAASGIQWELQSTVIGGGGALNISNIDSFTNPITILANGKVGVGSTGPSERLSVAGNICATGTIGVCSDARYKTNLRDIPEPLEKVESLRGVYFDWKRDEFPAMDFKAGNQVGFVAQELKEVLPEAVSQGSDGYYSVDYGRLTPLLVEAIKEQQAQIDELKSRLDQLQEQVRLANSDR